jgi:hypothetical protein
MYDKIWDGRNEGKGKGGAPLQCPLCDAPDGMDHWVKECQDDYLVDIRYSVGKALRAYEIKSAGGGKRSVAYCNIARELTRAAMEGDGKTWCGLWSDESLQRFEGLTRGLQGVEWKMVGGLFEGAGIIMARAVSEMWASRKVQPDEIRVEEGEHGQERRAMRGYLAPDDPGRAPGADDIVIGTVGRGRKRKKPQAGQIRRMDQEQTVITDFMRPAAPPEDAGPRGLAPRYGLGSFARREFITERREAVRVPRAPNRNPVWITMGNGDVFIDGVLMPVRAEGPLEGAVAETALEDVLEAFDREIATLPKKRSRAQRGALGIRLTRDMECALERSRRLTQEEYGVEDPPAEGGDVAQRGEQGPEEEDRVERMAGMGDVWGLGGRAEIGWEEPPGD